MDDYAHYLCRACGHSVVTQDGARPFVRARQAQTVAILPADASHAAAARNVTIRLMLNAALANTKRASTVARPRSFTLRKPAMVLSHANARSMRGRAC